MKTKGTGEGSVYFNKQRKRWNAQYSEYDYIKNKNTIKTRSFKSEEEAKKFLETIMYQRQNPIFIEHNGIPMNELLRANAKLKLDTNQISPTQYGRTLRTIERLEKAAVVHKKIDEIVPEEIQQYLNSQKHLSDSSIKKEYQMFTQAFKLAINKGYIMRNPMINVIRPRSNKESKKVRALTLEEQQAFTEYLLSKDIEHCKYKNVFLLQMYMGLRVGEALALTNYDIDLKNRRINVHRTLTTDEDGRVMMGNTTKTYAGRRILPIPNYLYPHIVEQMRIAESDERNEEKLLFKPEYRKYTYRGNVNSELHRILERQFGIIDISTHSLRHTFGTRCIESGMQPVVVQRLMGHTDVSVTLNTYTSVFDKFKNKEIEKVNQYYMDENLISNCEEMLLDNENFIENDDREMN